MNSRATTLVLLCGVLFALASCSGVQDKCTTNCGGGGGSTNGSLNLTISDTPPAGVGIISFTLPIAGISLTPSSGSNVSVYSGGSFELTRLQSDSNPVALGVSVAPGTYTALNITLGTTSGIFVNASGSSISYGNSLVCAANAYCDLPSGAATTITYTFPSALTISSGQTTWLGLDFNLNNAITSTNGITVDLTQTNVLTVLTSPRSNVPSGYVDSIDDFTGVVTGYASGSSITVKSGTRGTLTSTITSATTYDDPQGLCSTFANVQSCISATGSTVVSVQSYLSTSGSVVASEIDVVDNSGNDSVEGLIYPSSCNGGGSFALILQDLSVISGNTTLTGLPAGSSFCLTPSNTATYLVDSGLLSTAGITSSQTGFQGSSDITAGQVVRVQVANVTAGSLVGATAENFLLRYSRFAGTVNTVSGNNFSVSGLPTYLGFNLPPVVATYPTNTSFEGVTGVSDSAFSGAKVAFRALFFSNAGNSPQNGANFFAAKVRVN